MPPHVDLVIVFRGSSRSSSKRQVSIDAQKAEQQYARLLNTLKGAGLHAVGRRGERQGNILVLVSCPQSQLFHLVRHERETDFLSGLPTASIPSLTDHDAQSLTPADRLRLIHTFVASTKQDGGLGIIPGTTDWDLVESIMGLHDRKFNETWIRSWTTRKISPVQLGAIREQFGDSVALYFYFLSSYARALIFPAILGITFYSVGQPYSSVYSTLLLLWATTFVEWWRVHERKLSVRWGTRGSFWVETRRAQYTPGFPWWKREMRIIASAPVILMFAIVLAALLTGIFVFEAFVTQLYTGPGHRYVSFSPTILFVALVPRVLSLYQASAQRFTAWENHAHQSSHAASLTLKTFALSAVVAYLGLALSAFVYVPFGETVMNYVQAYLYSEHSGNLGNFVKGKLSTEKFGGMVKGNGTAGVWEVDVKNARGKLNPSRLQDQMFAYTVTNQAINTFVEIGLPFIMRAFDSFRTTKTGNKNGGKKKRVAFEDEVPMNGEKGEIAGNGKEEREFLEMVRREVALPEYDLFGDYSEMVTQFGYVALWSTIWPLAPVMALVNNFLELRSDAFKITVHNRRPMPTRTDTIGPWLDALISLTWLSALTNSALVYLFRPSDISNGSSRLFSTHGNGSKDLLIAATLIALAASHGYLLLRVVVRHLVERVAWKGSVEAEASRKAETHFKEEYLKSLKSRSHMEGTDAREDVVDHDDASEAFWQFDEGVEEIRRAVKQA